MNRIIKYLSIVALGLVVASCSLDTDDVMSINDKNFYKTVEDADMALIACYDGYQRAGGYGVRPFHLVSEIMSDDCFGGTGSSDPRDYQVIDRFDPSEAPSYTDLYNDLWIAYYNAIYRCNAFLANIDGIEWTQETQRGQYEGETRFMRALCYFDLVRMFGNIPLLTVPSREIVPQATPAAVFEQIVVDLKYAAENISTPWSVDRDGHATAAAAKAMLGRVYLFYTGYYGAELTNLTKEEVVAGLTDIYNSNEYGLVDRFGNMWRAASQEAIKDETLLVTLTGGDCVVPTDKEGFHYAGRACSTSANGKNEYIFSVKYNYTGNYDGDGDGNGSVAMMGPRNFEHETACPIGKGWGSCTVNPSRYTSSLFTAADERKEASIVDMAATGMAAAYLEQTNGGLNQREYTGYMNRKYIPFSYLSYDAAAGTWRSMWDGAAEWGADFQLGQYQDWVIMRYADVLLMLAELTDDVSYATPVRERAGLTALSSTSEIMEERHREFMFEGIRYWDLLRQGVDAAAATIAGSWNVLDGGTAATVVISADRVRATRGLSQIPVTQINLSNNVYVQNPGW